VGAAGSLADGNIREVNVSLTTRKQQAKAVPPAARKRAQQAAQQLAPLAKSARDSAVQRLRGARGWAAPKVEQAAHNVQENVAPKVSAVLEANVAPKVSAVLEATAHRLEPAPAELKKLSRRARRRARATALEVKARREKLLAKAAKPKRRWPKLVGGAAFVAATIGAIAAVAMRRGRDKVESDLDDAAATGEESGEPRSVPADADAGSDGQVRTP